MISVIAIMQCRSAHDMHGCNAVFFIEIILEPLRGENRYYWHPEEGYSSNAKKQSVLSGFGTRLAMNKGEDVKQ